MIQVDKDYIIEPDSRSYVVFYDTHRKRFDKKENKEFPVLNVIGYYSTLSGAIKGVLDHKTKISLGKNNYSLQEVLSEVRRLNNELEDILAKVLENK